MLISPNQLKYVHRKTINNCKGFTMSRRTIQSPGVEIREIDLTQRPGVVVGTSVFVAGFSNQGPDR